MELSTGEVLTAKHILIAAGGHPVRPDMPNAELGLVSDDIFGLENLPKSILIVGGGYIACEFACILHGMGVEVTQYYRGAQILRGFDEEARGLIAEEMRERGIDVHTGTNILEMRCAEEEDIADTKAAHMGAGVEEVGQIGDSGMGAFGGHPEKDREQKGPIWVKATTGREHVFDAVLFATGRKPNTGDIGPRRGGRHARARRRGRSRRVQPVLGAVDLCDRRRRPTG